MTVAAQFQAERSETPYMGEVKVSVYIENLIDRENSQVGLWNPTRVRAITVEMIVDTGSTLMVLPESMVARLGLRPKYKAQSRLADGTSIETWIAAGATVRLLDRQCTVDCVIAPEGSPALLGQIPLEEMDLLVDCRNQQVVGRHPGGPRISM